MSETLDFGSPQTRVLNFLPGHDRCSRNIRQEIIARTADTLGLEVSFVPYETKVDRQRVCQFLGISSVEEGIQLPDIEQEYLTDGAVSTLRRSTPPAVFFARLPGCNDYEQLADRFDKLHTIVTDLTRRLN